MSQRIRMSKKLLAQLPADVAEALVAVQDDGRGGTYFSTVTFENRPAPYRHYFMEGYDYTFLYGGRSLHMEMVSGDTLGARDVRHEIGAEQAMPAGTVVIAKYYRYSASGAPYGCTVTCIGEPALDVDGSVRQAFAAQFEVKALPAPQA